MNKLFATKAEYNYWLSLVEALSLDNSELLKVISESLNTIWLRKHTEIIAFAGPLGCGKTQFAALIQHLQPDKFEVVTLDTIRHDFKNQDKPWVLREQHEVKALLNEKIQQIKSVGKIPVLDSVVLDQWFIDMVNKPSTLLFSLWAFPHQILIPDVVRRHEIRIDEGHVYDSTESEDDQDLHSSLRVAFAGHSIMNGVKTLFNNTTSYILYLNNAKNIPPELKVTLTNIWKENMYDVLKQYTLIEPIVKKHQRYTFSAICRQLMQRLDAHSRK